MVGGVVAIVSALVGIFTVIRGQSFAGHALSDIGTAGGSGAILVGVPTLSGYVTMNLAAAGVMELIGVRRSRGRDVATGIVLGASLGLAALFLYLDTTHSTTTGATINVLFGSIFTISASLVPVVVVLGLVSLGLMGVPLPAPAAQLGQRRAGPAARGVPVRLVGIGYLAALAIAVSLSAITIGRDPVDGTADRPGRRGPQADQADRAGHRHRRCARRRGHVARDPSRLRQRRLVVR